jgi:hypothetical protein
VEGIVVSRNYHHGVIPKALNMMITSYGKGELGLKIGGGIETKNHHNLHKSTRK